MQNYEYFTQANHSQYSLLKLSVVFLKIILILGFSTDVVGQVAFPLPQLDVIHKASGQSIIGVKAVGKQLFVATTEGVWLIKKDSQLPVKVVNGVMTDIEALGDQLFVGTQEGLWLINKNDQQPMKVVSGPSVVDRFDDADGFPIADRIGGRLVQERYIIKLEVVGKRLFAITPKGLWIISKDGTQATKVDRVKGDLFAGNVNEWASISAVIGERLFVFIDKALWMVSQEAEQVYEIVNGLEKKPWITAVGDRLIVSRKEESLIFNNNGEQIVSLKDIFAHNLGAFNGLLFVSAHGNLWVVNEETKRAAEVEGFDLKGTTDNAKAAKGNLEIVSIEDMGCVDDIKVLGDRLFFCTRGGLWVVSKDNKRAIKNTSLSERRVNNLDEFDGQLFVSTDRGLWILSDESKQPTKVEGIEGRVGWTQATDEQFFIFAGEVESPSLWVIRKGSTHANRVSGITPVSATILAVEDDTYVRFDKRQQNGTFVQTVYRVDPTVKIKTNLYPGSWWAGIVSYVLPSDWLPAEKVRVNAFYSNENGKGPYDDSFPTEFRYAKADGSNVPAEDKFSTSEQFSYEISWGNNDVHYWVKDKWGNTFEEKATYRGVPSQYFFAGALVICPAAFVLGCFAFAPKVDFCHSAIMNPWLRKYFSLGSIPLLLSIFPSLRRHLLRRYSASLNKDKEFSEWKIRFVCPDEEFQPENFGKKLEGERRLLLTGQSGIGKTSYLKRLTANYASPNKPTDPKKVFPIYVSLTNYGGNSLEELVYNQLFSYGKITDQELVVNP